MSGCSREIKVGSFQVDAYILVSAIIRCNQRILYKNNMTKVWWLFSYKGFHLNLWCPYVLTLLFFDEFTFLDPLFI